MAYVKNNKVEVGDKKVYIENKDGFYIIYDKSTNKEILRVMENANPPGKTIEDFYHDLDLFFNFK